jgi:two-component system, NtrC family, sensor kinase
MSLRTKIELILLAIFIFYVVFIFSIQKFILYPSFKELERIESLKDMKRCKEAIKKEIYHLDLLCNDWSGWDDTYMFMEDGNKNYIKTNLVPETFINNDLSIIAFCKLNGDVVWAGFHNQYTNDIQIIHKIPNKLVQLKDPILYYNVGENPFSNITMTDWGPMLISLRPVLTSENKGPPRGTLLMARFFNDNFIKSLSERTQLSLTIHSLQVPSIPEDVENILKNIKPYTPTYFDDRNKEILKIYSIIDDIHKNPIFLLQVDSPRNITSKSITVTSFATLSIVGFGLLTILVMLIFLQINVVKPILDLKNHALSIGKKDAIHDRIPINRRDEIGLLTKEFNSMMEKLSDARKKLIEQSYQSGVSEMISGVLHNIRNSLNPVTTRLDSILHELMSINTDNIKKAQKELSQIDLTEEHEKDLKQYLKLSLDKILDQIDMIREKINDIVRAFMHIEIILNNQEIHCHKKHPSEMIRLNIILKEVINSFPINMKENVSFEIDPDIEKIDLIKAPRLLLFKVFSYLLTNSLESVKLGNNREKKLKITAFVDFIGKNKMVHIKFEDYGLGIEPENMTRIFERGYNTKSLSGESLHWCANTINNMNGTLYAESKGIGQGSCFHLLIPFNQEN